MNSLKNGNIVDDLLGLMMHIERDKELAKWCPKRV